MCSFLREGRKTTIICRVRWRSTFELLFRRDMTKDELNTAVIDYALDALRDYDLSWPMLNRLLIIYPGTTTRPPFRCEAEIRTQGLTRPYVVASCAVDGRDIVYSDFSGKKQRSVVVGDFPFRQHDFSVWYGRDSKPYQHRVLFDHIEHTLGKIGSFAPGVSHPIGYCAEQNVANRLLLDSDASIGDVEFSVAIRPKTGEVIDYCDNCRALFPTL